MDGTRRPEEVASAAALAKRDARQQDRPLYGLPDAGTGGAGATRPGSDLLPQHDRLRGRVHRHAARVVP